MKRSRSLISKSLSSVPLRTLEVGSEGHLYVVVANFGFAAVYHYRSSATIDTHGPETSSLSLEPDRQRTPIGAVLSNQYVPGIDSSASSTVERIFTGYALDPVNNLLTEFLPDVASRVHIRIIFVQRILNNIASSNNGVTLQ